MAELTSVLDEDQDQDGLLVTRRAIVAARSRAEQPSDGGSTGVSDTND